MALLLLLVSFLSGPTTAAVPPLPRDRLVEESTDIVTGTVLEVTSKMQIMARGKDRVYHVKFYAEAVEKGPLTSPHIFTIAFRQTAERPEGWVGPQGQNEVLKVHDRVRLFLVQRMGRYELVRPNGWEPSP